MARIDIRTRRFVKAELERVPTAARFSLRVGDVEGHSDLVDAWDVAPRIQDLTKYAEELAAEIMERANDTAAGQVGIVYLHLISHTGGKKTKVRGKDVEPADPNDNKLKRRALLKFVVRGMAAEEDPTGRLISESEPATKQGFMGLMMRHFESREQTFMGLVRSLTESVVEENTRLRTRVGEMEDRAIQLRQLQDEVADKTMERKMVIAAQEGEEERKRLLMQKLAEEVLPRIAEHIPDVLQKIGIGEGRKPEPALPADVSEFRKEVGDIIRSVPQEQLIEIMQKLPREKRERLVRLVEG